MKTKISTFIAICILGFIGINADATNSSNTNKIVKVGNSETVKFVLNGVVDANIDFQKEAQTIIKLVADKEEAKAVQKLLNEGYVVLNGDAVSIKATKENTEFIQDENSDAKIDFQKEVQLITKMVSDKEEAKAIQKLIDEGKISRE